LALCVSGNPDIGGAVEGRDLDFATQGCGGEADRHLAVQIVAVALEYGCCLMWIST
jgi:hypothetical protein